MGLHRLDFFSNSPKNFIFQNTSNKTNFGGVLTLIYIILLLAIVIYHIIDYELKEDFYIEYSYYEELLFKNNISTKNNNEKYNQYFDFEFIPWAKSRNESFIPSDLKIINKTNNQTIPINTTLNKRILDIKMLVVVEDFDYDYIRDDIQVSLFSYYHGYILDHQNKNCPVHRIPDDKIMYNEYLILPKNPIITSVDWKIIKYKADTGFSYLWNKLNRISEEDQKKIGLKTKSINRFYYKDYSEDDSDLIYPINGTDYRVIGAIQYNIDFSSYDEYKRTEKDIFDSLSNACSLSLTLYNILSFFFVTFYSNNFDNYKITEKILYNTKTINFENKTRTNSIELKNDFNQDNSLLPHKSEDDIMIINDEKSTKLKEQNYQDIENDGDENLNPPQLRFYEYIFNNIYSKCCNILNQKIISKCNEIISKYYSIEQILYNQIKLENLFKDYHWNDPTLNNYENNELIIELKNLISLN